MPCGRHFRCCIRGECLPGESEEHQRPQTQYRTYPFILPALAVAHEASKASKNVFAVKDSQCRGCESFEQVEPFLGTSEPAGEIPKQSEGSPEAVVRVSEPTVRNPEQPKPQFTSMLAI